MRSIGIITWLLAAIFSSKLAFATPPPVDVVRVSLLRASPGYLEPLLKEILEQNIDQLVLRHSQGDHWDVMIVGRFGDNWQEKHSKKLAPYSWWLQTPVDYDLTFSAVCNRSYLDFFVPKDNLDSPDTPAYAERRLSFTKETTLFHIEMFMAAGGKLQALRKQREMENEYLTRTGRRANTICWVESGSDIDVFTIGFYRDLAHFAESPTLPPEALEQAAVEAGFKNRADISFHLRELIVGHHDTLATKVN